MRTAPLRALLLAGFLAASSGTGEPVSPGRWLRYPFPGAEVKVLVFAPGPGGPAWLGTAQGGVYVSTDRGKSWAAPSGSAPFPGFAVTALVPDPATPGAVWAGATGIVRGGLLARTEDGGRTWSVVRRWSDTAGARAVAVGFSGGKKVVATAGDLGVEVSLDGGATWRFSRPPLDRGSGIAFLAFAPGGRESLWAGSFRHPFRSNDLGRSWERRAVGMIEDTQVFGIDFSPSQPSDFWAATCGWVYRSLDGGESWTRYKEGLLDRRTHVVRRDPAQAGRVLAGTTGGLFETRDSGKSFRRVGPETVVNAVAFDPADPSLLLVGTESDGVLRSEDGGASFAEANAGLSEARIAAVVRTASGRVLAARAADGKEAGLFEVDGRTAMVSRVGAPPATVVALAATGERVVAATPDGIYVSEGPGEPFRRVREGGATALLAVPPGVLAPALLVAATPAGVFSSHDGTAWRSAGLSGAVDALWVVLVEGTSVPTVAARSAGRILFWDGTGWSPGGVPAGEPRKLAGGFGRARGAAAPTAAFFPVGLEAHKEGAVDLLSFRGADAPETEFLVAPPEPGLPLAGWAGDPRRPEGLWLATVGRGLFRFVPGA